MTPLRTLLAVGSFGGALCSAAAAVASEPLDLVELSLEDLFAQEVSSVAKRPQNVKEAPAAVFVIGREDIRRSGATTIPELLRMVPGMEVAALQWRGSAVTARGFNGQFANKLLVLIDGRAIYVSAVSGVLWDQQALPVEDIERIEVVRGPGAALWGANAVNGVINVITKHPIDTQGGLAAVDIDSGQSGRVHLRQGVRIGETGVLRLSAQGRRDDQIIQQAGIRGHQIHETGHLGVRYDAQPTTSDAVTLQGDITSSQHENTGALASAEGAWGSFEAGNVLARWTRTDDETGARTSLQGYFDHAERKAQFIRRLWSLEFSSQFKMGEAHDVVWGLGYRYTENRNRSRSYFQFADSEQSIYDGFVQDDISLMSNRLKVSVGTKLEHSARTGLEIQPSVRAIWLDPAGWSMWAAVSRAVRTPSDYEADGSLDLRPAMPVVLAEGFAEPETVVAYEIGWRGRLSDKVTLDATAFYNRYDGLIGARGEIEIVDGAPTQVFRLANLTSGATYGAEASVTAQMASNWRVQASLSLFKADIDPITGVFTSLGALSEAQSPDAQLSVRSMIDLSETVDLDIWARHVGELSGKAAEEYSDLDVRLAWRPTPTSEFFAAGENLLHKDRVEFVGGISIIPLPEAVVDRRLRVGLKLQY